MFRQFDVYPHDILSRSGTPVVRPAVSPVERTIDVVADHEVPLFALLRSTLGLPLEDARWWPERPKRRRRVSTLVEESDSNAEAPVPAGRHTTVMTGGRPFAEDVTHPTVALLERTLAGLRTWGSPASTPVPKQAGRHQLVSTGFEPEVEERLLSRR